MHFPPCGRRTRRIRACAASLAFLFLILPAGALQPPSLPASPGSQAVPGPDNGMAYDEYAEVLPISGREVEPRPLEPASTLENRALLLCWHSFLGNASLSTDFSLRELASQLDALAALGYRFIDLADALAGRFKGRLNLVATIDDGHRTVPEAVTKVFLPRGIRPALFIYPAIIGNVPQAMTETQLREMSASGCLIGAHGYHHLYVNEALYKSEPAEFMKEIYKAKTRTEAIIGLPVSLFAYPYGAYSPVTIAEVNRAGYSAAIAVRPGFVYAGGPGGEDFETPRLVVTRENWGDIYALLSRNAAGRADKLALAGK